VYDHIAAASDNISISGYLLRGVLLLANGPVSLPNVLLAATVVGIFIIHGCFFGLHLSHSTYFHHSKIMLIHKNNTLESQSAILQRNVSGNFLRS